MPSTLVSVILPAYNAQATVAGAIYSALSGTHQDVEIVVCDDASTDRTLEVIRSIDDPRVRILSHLRNLGPGPSRDRAIDASKGKWITFLDADDEWAPSRIEALLDAGGGDHGIVVFDDIVLCHHTKNGMVPWRRIHGQHAFGAKTGTPIDVPHARWASSRQFVMQPLISTATLRSSGVRHSGRLFQEDTEFFLRLISKGLGLRYLPSAGYRYRITPGSLSSVDGAGMRTREVLKEVITLFAHDQEMQAALEAKIRYRTFTRALRTLDLNTASSLATKDPSLVAELVRRIGDMTWYQISRWLHNGTKR